MLMFPYIANLLAAMLLGALIGAERQWRQRMAGLRTNALVATGAAVFILSSISTSPDSPGRIAAQVVSGIGFLGAGVIMREGMNVRGLNTAATLWCSAAIGVLCGLGQFWQAAAATLIILCANILLREAAQRINQIPGATEEEKCYVLSTTHGELYVHEDVLGSDDLATHFVQFGELLLPTRYEDHTFLGKLVEQGFVPNNVVGGSETADVTDLIDEWGAEPAPDSNNLEQREALAT